jgi:formate hydrogenlyase subunit 3/multisubunit Na+/H+ antiporter MnhD subunit
MLIPIVIMAALCILIGLFPGLVSGAMQSAASTLLGLTRP